MKVKYVKKAFNANGYDKASLQNFSFSDVEINAATAGDVNYAKDWQFNNVVIKAKDNSVVIVKNSDRVKL